jgi:TonB family protein
MILAWMIYALLVGLALTVASAAIEQVARALKIPSRFLWVAATVVTIAWPVVGFLLSGPRPRAIGATRLPAVVVTGVDAVASLPGRLAALLTHLRLDGVLLVAWALTTLLLLVRLVVLVRAIGRLRQRWPAHSVDGVDVRLSTDVGPAVVGWPAMEIVLPKWALALEHPLRGMVLRHEQEHRSAGDPALLLASYVVTALVPWNPAIWLQARRLRLAIETDCDARVVTGLLGGSAERYQLLLITMAQQRVNAALVGPALSEPTSNLERRILAMQRLTSRVSLIRLAGVAAVATIAIAVACTVHAPDRAVGPRSASPTSNAGGPGAGTFFEFQVEQAATPLADQPAPRYPDELRAAKIEGEVLVQMVVNEDGSIMDGSIKVVRSSNDQFTKVTVETLKGWRFKPAQVRGRAVRQLIQMPFQFSLAKGDKDMVLMKGVQTFGPSPKLIQGERIPMKLRERQP